MRALSTLLSHQTETHPEGGQCPNVETYGDLRITLVKPPASLI